jgi:Na+-driven multidrug efflux pump
MINKSLAINYFQKNKQTVKLMFIVMLPILSQYFIEALITFVDNFFALKTEDRKISLNAIGQVNNIFLLFYFFSLAISASAGIYFNQFLSQKNYQKNKEIVRLQLILAMPFVIFAAFILYFQSEKILSFLFESDFSSKNEKLIKKATSFLKIIVFSYPFAVYSIIFYNVMYMSGYNKLPFFIALFSFFLKLTILLFLFKLSVLSIEKIAIITLITRIFEFI